MKEEVEKLMYDRAIRWVKEAGRLIKALMKEEVQVEYKQHKTDLVTKVDHEVEAFLLQHIRQHYPTHRVLSEETGMSQAEDSDSPYLWIIDPIDGTTNFINQQRDFGISLALCKDYSTRFGIIYDVSSSALYRAFLGEGVYRNDVKLSKFDDGQLDEALVALSPHWRNEEEVKEWASFYHLAPYVRGLRSYGSTSIELCLLSDGRLDGYITHHIYPWDYAAGRLFIEELGGRVSDLQGNPIPLTYRGGVVAGTAHVHRQLIDRLKILFPHW